MLDDVGTTVYTYTPGGFLATESGPFGDDAVTNYYSNRLRIGFGLQEPAGAWTNGFGYDAIVRLGADATWLKARHNPAQGKGASAWPPSASLAWVAARETSSPVRAAYPLARLASPFYHAPSGLGCKGEPFPGATLADSLYPRLEYFATLWLGQ